MSRNQPGENRVPGGKGQPETGKDVWAPDIGDTRTWQALRKGGQPVFPE